MNLKIKSQRRLEAELQVATDFKADYQQKDQRELVECIMAKSQEAKNKTNRKLWFFN